jgi:2-polyprenyl-3-methyl-5-hydroxy-6-metoxy-1,4-benzoquinol methylase
MIMRLAEDPILNYVARTPLALALERALECQVLSREEFVPPVLDIGCGDGLFASILFADKVDTGVDLNSDEIACASRTGAYRELICCPGSNIPKPAESYRTVFSNSVLEHIPDVSAVMAEAHRLLEPGGEFIFTVPTDEFEKHSVIHQLLSGLRLTGAAARFGRLYNKFWRHFHAYSTTRWKQLVTDAGFEVVKAVRYNPPRMTLRNDYLTPVAVISSVVKRVTGRWVLWPRFRQILLRPLAKRIERNLSQAGIAADGSLVLIRARKVLKTGW